MKEEDLIKNVAKRKVKVNRQRLSTISVGKDI